MPLRVLLFLALGMPSLLPGQAEFRVYNDHPRLFLEADRLKRLSRDAERQTGRWKRLLEQVESGSTMPERAAAVALTAHVAGDEEGCRQALELLNDGGPPGPHPLRQTALVYDWCFDVMDEQARAAAAARLVESAKAAPDTAEGVRDAVLALIAASGQGSGAEAALGEVLRRSWEAKLLPALQQGRLVDRGSSLIALLELAHALRYNLDRDIWSEAAEAFRTLPLARILGYPSLTVESEEGLLRVHALVEGDAAEEAALGRIAEMLLVAYESRSSPSQFLQGWLRNDSYTLRGPLGALYEFLWINPYLPGLAPASAPKWTFDPVRSRIFAQREEGWMGYYDGDLHVVAGNQVRPAGPQLRQEPIYVAGAAIVWPADEKKWTVEIPQGSDRYGPAVLLVGMQPGRQLEVRVGKADWKTHTADRAGVIVVRNEFEKDQSSLKYETAVKLQLR